MWQAAWLHEALSGHIQIYLILYCIIIFCLLQHRNHSYYQYPEVISSVFVTSFAVLLTLFPLHWSLSCSRLHVEPQGWRARSRVIICGLTTGEIYSKNTIEESNDKFTKYTEIDDTYTKCATPRTESMKLKPTGERSLYFICNQHPAVGSGWKLYLFLAQNVKNVSHYFNPAVCLTLV